MDFACKQFNLDEVVKCSLSLTRAEFEILEFLMKNSAKKFHSSDIAKSTKLDLSTVQRSMKKMSEKNIVRRSQINLDGAGYTFVYCVCNKQEIKDLIKATIKGWADKFDSEIERW